MKKTKLFFISIMVLCIFVISFSKVNAHSVELDPESLISMPIMIVSGKGTVSIADSITNYTSYFQAVKIESSVFSQMETIENNGNIELEKLKNLYTALKPDMDNLKEIYEKAYDDYIESVRNSSLSTEELQRIKSAYEIAETNYQNKVKEYNDKVSEYNNKAKEINLKIKELTPMYIENNWSKITDDKIFVDISKFSGEQHYVVWVKLVTSSETYYDETIYSMTGTKSEISVSSVSLDKTELSITEESSYTLKATIEPSDATNKSLIWTSDNENIVKVENGKVIGISEGIANITVMTEDGNYTATCKVTVNKKVANSSNIDDKKENLIKDEDAKLDNTISKKDKLPQTGSKPYIIIGIIIVSISGIIFFKKDKYMNF